MIEFAQNLGYVPQAHLAQYRSCGGIFPRTCQQVLYFKTLQNQNEIQQKLDELTLNRKIPQAISGYSLLDINIESEHVLTINGVAEPLDPSLVPEPLAYEWLFTEGGENWGVIFYSILNDGNVYELDHQGLVGNILVVILQT